jgi:hypothetical protein
VREAARVLCRGGEAVYVIGENSVRGTYVRTSVILSELADQAGLTLLQKRRRALPPNRRYLPPPVSDGKATSMDIRMRREVILRFRK